MPGPDCRAQKDRIRAWTLKETLYIPFRSSYDRGLNSYQYYFGDFFL